jgi:rubredoxin
VTHVTGTISLVLFTKRTAQEEAKMAKWECLNCGYIYDPAEGDPVGGIAPGTLFEDLPDERICFRS